MVGGCHIRLEATLRPGVEYSVVVGLMAMAVAFFVIVSKLIPVVELTTNERGE